MSDAAIASALVWAIERSFAECVRGSYQNNFVAHVSAIEPAIGSGDSIANEQLRYLYEFAEDFFFSLSHGDLLLGERSIEEAQKFLQDLVISARRDFHVAL